MKTAVVTGGSSGIGLSLCRLLSEKNYKVYSLSRTENEENNAIHIAADVTDDASVKSAFQRIAEEAGCIDLLINNAGFGISGTIEFTETADAERQFQVNFFGMLRCIKAALPLLRRTKGRILNISSAAAIFSIPFQGFYSASKAAINSLTLALRNEVKNFGITVCAVMPGDVRTGFTAMRKKDASGDALYHNMIEASVAVMEKDEQNGMTADHAARCIIKIAEKRSVRPLYTVGMIYKLYYVLNKLLPQRTVNWIVGLLYMKKKK